MGLLSWTATAEVVWLFWLGNYYLVTRNHVSVVVDVIGRGLDDHG